MLIVVSNPLGGIRSYLLYNLPHLADSGYVFTFLAPGGGAFDSFADDVKGYPGVAFVAVPKRNRRAFLFPRVRRALRSNRFTLIHSQGLRAGTEVCLANLGLRIPNIITLHDVIVSQNDVPGRFKWLKKSAIGHISAKADAIIAVSQDCAENYLNNFPRWKRARCRLVVVRNGVDVARLERVAERSERGKLRRELGLAGGAALLGFFGRFMPQKGFIILLDALRRLLETGSGDRVRLIATKDPHGYRGEYMREVEKDAALSRIVRFIEPVADIATVLPQIDVLVMPSLCEACPLLPMEAMVLGVPVVGSDCIGLREVLSGTPSLAPRAGDGAALARAIMEMLAPEKKEEAKRFVAEARVRFDVQPGAEKLRAIYDS
ncbi:MAG: glycosyltransferase family 4 protein, partial [Planctomycetota bacterium]